MVFYPFSMIDIPAYFLGAPYILAPLFSYITGTSPFETGVLMTKIFVPLSVVGGGCVALLTKDKKDSTNLNRVLGLMYTAGGLYACFIGWVGLGSFTIVKTIASPFVTNFLN